MGVSRTYRKSGEKAIVTFDFVEFASGLGFQEFFIMKAQDNSGVTNILTSEQWWSSSIESQQAPGTGETNFDSSEFNMPRTVKGTAVMNIGTQGSLSGGDDTIKVRLKKWDGSTETNITAQHTKTITDTATIQTIEMPCTETIIKKGEQLRLEIIVYVTGAAEWIEWGHDPKNRDGTILTPSSEDTITSSRINVPFKIDL